MNLLKTNLKSIPVWFFIVTLAVVVAGCTWKLTTRVVNTNKEVIEWGKDSETTTSKKDTPNQNFSADNLGITSVKETGSYSCPSNCQEYYLEIIGNKLPEQILLFKKEKKTPVALIKEADLALSNHMPFPEGNNHRNIISLPKGDYIMKAESQGFESLEVVISVGEEPGARFSMNPSDPELLSSIFPSEQNAFDIYPKLSNDQIIIRGRVADHFGSPIQGVKVSNEVKSSISKGALEDLFKLNDDEYVFSHVLDQYSETYTDKNGLYELVLKVNKGKNEALVSLNYKKEGYKSVLNQYIHGGTSTGFTLFSGSIYPDDYGYKITNMSGNGLLLPENFVAPPPSESEVQMYSYKLVNPANLGGISSGVNPFYIPSNCVIPSTIKVDVNNDGSSNDFFDFKNYTKRVLYEEWVQGSTWWQTNHIEESYKAAAVAIMSYAMSYASNSQTICNSTDCQVFDKRTTNQILTNSQLTLWVNSTLGSTHVISTSVDEIWGWVVQRNQAFVKAEFAAETNDNCTPILGCNPSDQKHWGKCGDGFFQRSGDGPPCNGGACFPLGDNIDVVSYGECHTGSHPRAMGQRGSIRWATGYEVSQNNNKGNAIGFPISGQSLGVNKTYSYKNWVELLSWYYPDFVLQNCSNNRIIDLSCEDFSCQLSSGQPTNNCGCLLDPLSVTPILCDTWISVDVANGYHGSSLYNGEDWHDWGPEVAYSFNHIGGDIRVWQRNKSSGFGDVDIFLLKDLNNDGKLDPQIDAIPNTTLSGVGVTGLSQTKLAEYVNAPSGIYYVVIETGSHGAKSGTTEINVEANCACAPNHPNNSPSKIIVQNPNLGTGTPTSGKETGCLLWDIGDVDRFEFPCDQGNNNSTGMLVFSLKGAVDNLVYIVTEKGSSQVIPITSSNSSQQTANFCIPANRKDCFTVNVYIGSNSGSPNFDPNASQVYELEYYWTPGVTCSPLIGNQKQGSPGGNSGQNQPESTISLTASTTTPCPGTQVVLTATGATSYTWLDENGDAICNNCGGSQTVAIPSGMSTVTYTVYEDGGLCAPETITLTVNSGPNVSISASPTYVPAPGGQLNLSANVNGGTSGYTYQWNWSGGSSSQQSISLNPSTGAPYSVNVTDGNGCTDATSVYVGVGSGTSNCTNLWDNPSGAPQLMVSPVVNTIGEHYGTAVCTTPSAGYSYPSCASGTVNDSWAKVIAQSSGAITIGISGQGGTNGLTNPRVEVRRSNGSLPGNVIGCGTNMSNVSVNNGETLWCRIWGNGGQTSGLYKLTFTQTSISGNYPDLTIDGTASFSVGVWPNNLIQMTVKNLSPNVPAGPYDIHLYASTDQNISLDDKTISWEYYPNGISGGATIYTQLSASQLDWANLGLAPGTYYMIASIDEAKQVFEGNIGETNNFYILFQNTFTVPSVPSPVSLPDVQVVKNPSPPAFTNGKIRYAPGEQVEVSYALKNAGSSSLPSGTKVGFFYLSGPGSWHPNAQLLHTTTLNYSIISGATVPPFPERFILPSNLNIGQIEKIAIVPNYDKAINEGVFWGTLDDIGYVAFLAVSQPYRPDYIAQNVTSTPGIVTPCGQVSVNWEVKNIGPEDATVNSVTSVYFSNSQDLSGKIGVESSISQSPLPSDATAIGSRTRSAPANLIPGSSVFIGAYSNRNSDFYEVNTQNDNNDSYTLKIVDPSYIPSQANILSVPNTACEGQILTFEAAICSGCSYQWTFGDGNSGSGRVINYQYSSSGTKTITLIVDNNCQQPTTTSQSIIITPSSATASILQPTLTKACVGDVVTFAASNSSGSDFSWNFGDGSSSTIQNPTHTFTNSGYYQVALIVSDPNGCAVEIDNLLVSIGDEVMLTGNVTDESAIGANDGSIDLTVSGGLLPYSFAWSNGATTKDLSNLAAGTYTVTVADNAGCTLTESFTVNSGTTGPPPLQIEARILSNINDTWTTVNLQKTFVSPVLNLSLYRPSATTKPVIPRARVINGSQIQVKVQATDGTTAGNHALNMVVLEEGVYNQQDHGVKMEVGKVLSTSTANSSNWIRESRTLQNTYTQPVILGQVMTYNDQKWSQFWSSEVNSRSNPPSSTSVAFDKNVGEDPITTRANEMIGYVVFEAGSGSLNGVPFVAGLGPDIVRGVGNAGTNGYTYSIPGISSSDIAIVSPAGMDGANGGWPVIFGPNPIGTNYLNLAFSEDQSNDVEEKHTTEQVFFAVFSSSQSVPCSVPINLTTTNITPTACTITWASVTGASSYDLEYQLDGASSWQTVANITAPPYVLSGLTPNSTYKARVKAQCNSSASNWSSEATFSTTCPTIQPNPTGINATCFGVLDGSATASPTGGQAPYSYDWGGFGNAATIQNLGPGTFTVIVTDANGCTATDQVTISEPQVLSVSGQTTSESAPNMLDGAIDITVTGGVAPYTFDWGVNGVTEDLTGLEGGQYTVQVTDANGCVETATFTVQTSQGITPPKMEIGKLHNSGQYWQTVNFQNTYQSPIILVSPILPSGQALPVVSRVKDVTSTQCKLSLQNPSGDTLTVPYSMYYWIIEEGTYTVAQHGIKMEAKQFIATGTSRKGAWNQAHITYQNSYSNPVVLAQVMSFNDSKFSVAWTSSSSRTSPPTPTSLSIGKHIGEDTDHTRAFEFIGYVVIEAGSGMIGNVAFEANVGADIVRGPDNSLLGYDYPIAQVETTLVAITTIAGMDGGDGCWAVPVGTYPLGSDLTLLCDEDQIGDSERRHTTENVGYIVFGARLNTNTRLAGPAPGESKKEEDIHSLIIFPNPVSGPDNFVSLSLQSAVEDNALIEVFDVHGKRVLLLDSWEVEVGKNTSTMNIEELQEGLFIVRVRAKNSSVARKMVVKR